MFRVTDCNHPYYSVKKSQAQKMEMFYEKKINSICLYDGQE